VDQPRGLGGIGLNVIQGARLAGASMTVMERKINIDDLITHKLKLADINQGFDLMHAGKSIRSVVVF
jgi:Zn-dependent alcohol dehydrogenase